MKTHRLALVAIAGLSAIPGRASEVESSRKHVEFLAAPERQGRLTGTEGARAAAAYIEQSLLGLGVQPLDGRESLQIPFEFTAGVRDSGSSLSLEGSAGPITTWSGTERIQALSFTDDGSVDAGLVFAGYGLVIPDDQGVPYDSYATLDVEGKIVLVLRYFPEDVDQDTRAILSRYSGLRYKALHARERGAKAVLVVAGPSSPNAGDVIPMSFDTALAGSGILAASIAGDVAERLFFAHGQTLEEVQAELDTGNPHVTGFEISNVSLGLTVAVERQRRTGYNVVGRLPGAGTADAERPVVAVGAHYDHLGTGDTGNSLAHKEEVGRVHPGADDNASGVAAVLGVAARLGGQQLKRDVVIALWSGEELGLLGSSSFLKQKVLDPAAIAAYLNFDMVGRLRENRLTLQAAGSSAAWPRLIERANVAAGFDLQIQDDPYLPTDSSAFNQAEVPTLNLFTGSHEDYHRPTDVATAIEYEELDRIAGFGARIVELLADAEDAPVFVSAPRSRPAGGGRDSLRAYTGTIPDYTTEVEGLRLGGVVKEGPAEAAGLRAGDVIVEFAGQTITNIYDYTYALDAIKIDEPVDVVYVRDGDRHDTTITPTTRR